EVDRRSALPKMGFDLGFGNSYRLGKDARLGVRLALGYDYDEVRRTGTVRRNRVDPSSPSGVSPLGELRFENGAMRASWGGLFSAGLSLGRDHEISVVSLFHREADDRTSVQEGDVAGLRSRRWQLEYVERMLSVNQILGDHRNLGGTKARLRWTAFGGLATRDTPDMRVIQYSNFGGEQLVWTETTTSGGRFHDTFSKADYGFDANLRFPLFGSMWGTTGARYRRTTAEFEMRRFRYRKGSSVADPLEYAMGPEHIFAPERIGAPADPSTLAWFSESTQPTDGYSGAQNLVAAFAMIEAPLAKHLKLVGGVRAEFFSQSVEARSPHPGAQVDPTLSSQRDDVDVMPGLSLTYAIPDATGTPKHVFRVGYGMTVARPQFRELAPFQFYDFHLDRLIVGNPELERTRIQNVDARYEWYFGKTDLVSASVFYKHFDDPIELQIRDPSNFTSRFINADSATAYGAEIEGRVGLERIHPSLKFFSIQGNLALMRSRVTLPDELSGAVRSNRPLFDQSPYVTNLSLRFDLPDAGVSASLVYNVYGPRITDVGVRADAENFFPDIVERAFHSLDFVASYRPNERWGLKLKVQNLTFSTQEFEQGDVVIRSIDRGLTATLGIGLSY
ncbi:MAG: TonB-dependent receptor, partial [Myxococcales bacterium]|nr:TonB-dependent receptor [Myxococcales bacterium]